MVSNLKPYLICTTFQYSIVIEYKNQEQNNIIFFNNSRHLGCATVLPARWTGQIHKANWIHCSTGQICQRGLPGMSLGNLNFDDTPTILRVNASPLLERVLSWTRQGYEHAIFWYMTSFCLERFHCVWRVSIGDQADDESAIVLQKAGFLLGKVLVCWMRSIGDQVGWWKCPISGEGRP